MVIMVKCTLVNIGRCFGLFRWFFGMTHLLHVRVHQVVVSGGYRSSDEGSGPSKGSRDPSERS